MGKNTPERQEFIIGNLKVELDQIASDEQEVIDLSPVPENVAEEVI